MRAAVIALIEGFVCNVGMIASNYIRVQLPVGVTILSVDYS